MDRYQGQLMALENWLMENQNSFPESFEILNIQWSDFEENYVVEFEVFCRYGHNQEVCEVVYTGHCEYDTSLLCSLGGVKITLI